MILNKILSDFLICLLLTIVIESAVAFILEIRNGYGQLIILLSNVITNPILNSILTVVSFFLSKDLYYYFLIPLEIAVVLTEGFIYRKMLRSKINPFLLSFILNFCSYFLGTIIIKIIF